MSASSIKAGAAYVELSTRSGLMDKGLAAAQASMRRLAAVTNTISGTMGKGFASVGGALSTIGKSAMSLHGALAGLAAASGVAMMVKGYADAAGNIDDMAKRTGLAASEIQGLQFAAQMSGTSIETVEAAIKKMQKAGISSGRGPMEDFRTFADVIAKIPDPSKRAAEAMKIFGKAGTQLLPMFEGGAAGIDDLVSEAESLGLVMSDEAVVAGEELGDTMDKLWIALGGVTNQLGAALAPVVMELANNLIKAASTVSTFVARNKDLIAALFSLDTYIAIVQTGFLFLMQGIESLAGTSGEMLSYMQEQWQALTDYVMPIINGIADALMSGQWSAAGEIAMLALEQAMRIGMQPLYNIWVDLYTFIADGAVNAVIGIANVFAGIPTTLMNAFSTVITYLTGAWDGTVNYIAKKLLYLYSLFDRSLDYEAAAKQMDKDAAQRANQRQKELDANRAKRDKELADANQRRLEGGQQMTQGIRDQADAKKSGFDQRINELGEQIQRKIEDVSAEAARQDAERPKVPPKVDPPPTPGMVSSAVASKTQGTFSGFGAGLFSIGTSALDRLVKQATAQTKLQEEIASNTGEDDALKME